MMDERELLESKFIGLITTFYAAAWQQMGKIANPLNGKIERNLEQAKYSIDMLIMIKEKTKGNLNSEEESSLEQIIANLQMNYIDELKNPSNPKKETVRENPKEEENKDVKKT